MDVSFNCSFYTIYPGNLINLLISVYFKNCIKNISDNISYKQIKVIYNVDMSPQKDR